MPAEILQREGSAQGRCRARDDVRDGGAGEVEGGEDLVGGPGELHLVVLVGHDQPVHLLGDLDEADLGTQDRHRETGRVGQRPQVVGRGLEVGTQFDDETRHALSGQHGQVGGCLAGATGQWQAGGQYEFAALDQIGEIGEVADVDPADRTVEMFAAADDVRSAGGHDREREDFPYRRLHLHSVKNWPGIFTVRKSRFWQPRSRQVDAHPAPDLRHK